MATNFETQFAITGFVCYNFGCTIASNMLFVLGGGFSGLGVKLSDEDTAMATIFGFLYMGAHIGATWRIRLNRYMR